MKYEIFRIVMVSMLLSIKSFGIPIVNENVANSGVITIYPDHSDAHRYYVAPNIVMIALDSRGVPIFSYTEYREKLFSIRGMMQMILVPAYTREELEVAKQGILKKDPQAEFSGVPVISSSLALTGELPNLIQSHTCSHVAGLVGQEQSCGMLLTDKGRKLFKIAIARNTVFTTLQFDYSIQAVIRKADGSFSDQIINHGIAVRIDGDQLSKYSDLISEL